MTDETTNTLDPDLEERWRAIAVKLDAASGALVQQGSVAVRLTPANTLVYSVRYFETEAGRRRQRAVYMGADPRLARRARELIMERRERVREAEAGAQIASACSTLLSRRHRRARR